MFQRLQYSPSWHLGVKETKRFENGTIMRLLTALEDFQRITLRAVPGRLARLCFAASLRRADSRYRHWGMERTYGEKAADSAIAQAHCDVFWDVLRAPVPDLFDEINCADESLSQYPQFLWERQLELLPRRAASANGAHLEWLLLTLTKLARGHSQSPVRAA